MFFLNLQIPKFKARGPTMNMKKCYIHSIFSVSLDLEPYNIFISSLFKKDLIIIPITLNVEVIYLKTRRA